MLKKGSEIVIGLAGNPNTGKSTVFNCLTGLKQHTGNWSGKTVTNAKGSFVLEDMHYVVYDLPGIYSLFLIVRKNVVQKNLFVLQKQMLC